MITTMQPLNGTSNQLSDTLSSSTKRVADTKSQQKRLLKKAHKLKLTLSQKTSIVFTDDSTPILLLGNAGLKNDVKREAVETALSHLEVNSDVIDVVMPPDETFCFVLFTNTLISAKAQNHFNGLILDTPELPLRPTVSLYAFYVTSADKYLDQDMQTVFNSDDRMKSSFPPGFHLYPDFITLEEATKLESSVLSNCEGQLDSHLKHRYVCHYGYEFLYGSNRVDPTKPLVDRPIPKKCLDIMHRVVNYGLSPNIPDQLTVNVYNPGQGIPPHVDTHSAFTDTLVVISLGSDVTFQLANRRTGGRISVRLPALSLLVMRDEARYLWTHSIPARKWDLMREDNCDDVSKTTGRYRKVFRGRRVSLTFRCVKNPPQCENCKWPEECDLVLAKKECESVTENTPSNNLKKDEKTKACLNDPVGLEEEHVHKVYDDIAAHFSETRHSGWPAVETFLLSLASGSLLIDLGCGNGKYLGANTGLAPVLPTDRSFNLCCICREKGGDPVQSDVLSVPYRSGVADALICIAVLHHLSTPQRRSRALVEIARVLKSPGGQALIQVWALEQNRDGKASNYVNKNREKKKSQKSDMNIPDSQGHTMSNDVTEEMGELQVHVNRTTFDSKDLLVPWHQKGDKESVRHRYYHLFSEGELEDLCRESEDLRLVRSYYDKGNWCAIVERL